MQKLFVGQSKRIIEPTECACSSHWPAVWYEKIGWQLVVGMTAYWALSWYWRWRYGSITPLWIEWLVLVFYMSTVAIDYYTTLANIRMRQEYEKRGLDFPCEEKNILLPNDLTRKQLIFSLPTLLAIVGVPLIFVSVAFGIVVGSVQLMVGLANQRYVRLQKGEIVQHDRWRARGKKGRRYPNEYLLRSMPCYDICSSGKYSGCNCRWDLYS